MVEAITTLGVGEALVSVLDETGTPTPVERVWMLAPNSQFEPLSHQEKQAVIASSVLAGVYEQSIDRESAYEMLLQRAEDVAKQQAQAAAQLEAQKQAEQAAIDAAKQAQKEQAAALKEQQRQEREQAKLKQRVIGSFATAAARQLGGRTGSRLVRGILGSLFR